MDKQQEKRDIGARMKAAAAAAGLGAYDVAAALGRRPATIYRWYAGENTPSIADLNRFADLAGVSAAYLRTGVEPLEETLLNWALLAREAGGLAALEKVRAAQPPWDAATAALFDQAAPTMLAILAELGGPEWYAAPREEQLALTVEFLARLREWRQRRTG